MLFLSVGLGKDSTAIEKIPLNTILQNKYMKSRLYLDIFVDMRNVFSLIKLRENRLFHWSFIL